MNGPLPSQYSNRNPLVTMFATQLAHRPRTTYGTNKPIGYTVCGKKGGTHVTYEEFRAARKSWMVCNVCWAPERIKRRR